MPHFIIECSDNVLQMMPAHELMQAVYDEAVGTGLFAKNDIKVRIAPHTYYKLADGKESFLHVFAYIMEGRTTGQKADLSKRMVECLNNYLPSLSILSMNIYDFELATYCNKSMIAPGNNGSRHFGLTMP